MAVTKSDVEAALARVSLPDGRSLMAHDLVRALSVEDGKVRFVIEAPNAEVAKAMGPLRDAAEKVVSELPGVTATTVALTAHGPAAKPAAPPSLKIGGHPKPQEGPTKPSGVKRIVAIASGKGGVGKSTVSSNVAVALARQGRKVGLLDADIYGPSQPHMLGVANERPTSADGKTMQPMQAHGLQVMSIGFLVDADQPMVWRGPMVTSALNQLLQQTTWHDLDYLIVDMPPGTGDIQLTLSQQVPVSGAVIVTTPQDIALIDARKGLAMFRKVSVPVLGVIENMSTHVCSACGHEEAIFGEGGGERMAGDFEVELLGQLPLDAKIRELTDSGNPTVIGDPESAAALAYRQAARRMTARLAMSGKDYSSKFPNIVVEAT